MATCAEPVRRMPEVEVTLTIAPPPCASMIGRPASGRSTHDKRRSRSPGMPSPGCGCAKVRQARRVGKAALPARKPRPLDAPRLLTTPPATTRFAPAPRAERPPPGAGAGHRPPLRVQHPPARETPSPPHPRRRRQAANSAAAWRLCSRTTTGISTVTTSPSRTTKRPCTTVWRARCGAQNTTAATGSDSPPA